MFFAHYIIYILLIEIVSARSAWSAFHLKGAHHQRHVLCKRAIGSTQQARVPSFIKNYDCRRCRAAVQIGYCFSARVKRLGQHINDSKMYRHISVDGAISNFLRCNNYIACHTRKKFLSYPLFATVAGFNIISRVQAALHPLITCDTKKDATWCVPTKF